MSVIAKKTKLVVVLTSIVIIILAACLYTFRTQSITAIEALGEPDLSTAAPITIYKVNPGAGYTETFSANDVIATSKISALLSSTKVKLSAINVEHFFLNEGDNYAIFVGNNQIYYDNGYLYTNRNRYKVAEKSIEPFVDTIKALSSKNGYNN